MNKIQNLFYYDGRVSGHSARKKKIMAITYTLTHWGELKYLKRWIESNKENANPWDDETPWITFGAVEFLNARLNKKSQIFEYGSGGSTVYFSKHCKNVVSVEHNKDWYKLIKDKLIDKGIENCDYTYISPSKRKSIHDSFGSTTEKDHTFRDYVTSISKYSDESFDLVSVDGRSRVACVKECYKKVKPGGMILLDNSDRYDYNEARMFLRDLGCTENIFFGLVGYEPTLAQTSVWIKNND